MSWKPIRINTYWSAEEAHSALEFIDELRDQILNAYEDKIIAMRLEELEREELDAVQHVLALDPDDF